MTSKPTQELSGALSEQGFTNLLATWSDLEKAVSTLLHHPDQVNGLARKTSELRQWLTDLISQDSDTALFLMFQIAATSTVGYSASHALVSATLCELVGQALALPSTEQKALTHAALTMNLGMTQLQDDLAVQVERPSLKQEELIRSHASVSEKMLSDLQVTDALWLEVVRDHHQPPADRTPLESLTPGQRLARILASIDRYGAMISPRKSRPGRTVGDSLRAIMGQRFDPKDEVGKALATSVGLYPPGTLVKLDNQEVAVVLRRTSHVNHPLIASILDSEGQAFTAPPVYSTIKGRPRILSSLPWSSIKLDVNRRTLISLGLFTATHAADLVARQKPV